MKRSDTGPFAIVPLWLPAALLNVKPRAFGTALAVYVTLAKWADFGTGVGWPSHRSIGAECGGLSETAVKDALKLLREVGAVEWTSTLKDDGSPGSNVYTMLRVPPATGTDPPGERSRPTPDVTATDGWVVAAPTNETHVEREPENEKPRAFDQLTAADLWREKLRDEPAVPGLCGTTRERFDEFWKLYPRKIAKPAATRAFDGALRREGFDGIMVGLHRWVTYWQVRNEPQFVPHPATWLNQDRWNDQPTRHGKAGSVSAFLADEPQPPPFGALQPGVPTLDLTETAQL